ncbi:neurogenic protein mastermind isoform X2 [Lutzomyia longipalpis]|nr:neurogenic protein mastermind isoform X2 [Lutzomyia longipalpis]
MSIWQQKFLKRPSDDVEAGPDNFEPPVKLQHNGSENLTKFSVEIVQQLEFTTSAANSQPQQISTNVTVKALTNTSVKSDGGLSTGGSAGGGSANGTAQQPQQAAQTNGSTNGGTAQKSPAAPQMHDLGNLVECKQEPDHDFADLEQCAAALEKDAAANGHFPGLSDLIGDDTNDESDTFKELISDLSDFHSELLDFEEKPHVEIKTEEGAIKSEALQHSLMDGGMMKGNGAGSPMSQFPGAAFSDNQSMGKRSFGGGAGGNGGAMSELSPAAQTLKHMAEQHQHKNAMGMGFPRPGQGQGAQGGGGGGGVGANGGQPRPNYTDAFGPFGAGDFIGGPQGNFHKNGPPGTTPGTYPSPDMVKQEMMYAQNEFDLKRMAQMPQQPGKMGSGGPGGGYKQPGQQQQYSPYGSPGSISNHGSPGPGFMGGPRGGPNQGPQNTGPPRPPSGPGGAGPQGPQGTLQMKQTQQLHISQQGPGGHGIQVSAGQHLHLSGDLKNSNVSVAAQQGVYFNQQAQQQPTQPPQSQAPASSASGPGAPQAPQQNTQGLSSDSYTVSQSQTINFTQQSMRQRQQQSVGGNMGGNGGAGGGIQTMAGGAGSMTNPNMPVHGNGSQAQMVSMSQSQHMSVSGMVQGGAPGGTIGQQPGAMGPTNGAGQVSNAMTMGPNMMNQGVPNQMGGMSMSPMNVSGAAGGAMSGPNGMVGTPNAAMMASMGGGPNGGPMGGIRHDPTKFMQQQQMMQRAQAMQHMQGARPPPPEYKAAQAQMIQAQMMHQGTPTGRFPNSAAAMRRMSQQPIPPSGPMMRPQHSMYMQHPNHGGPRTMGPYGQRPPNVQVGPEGMPMGSQQEWRHIFMSQQQNMNFNSTGMRTNFNPNHQGFNMQNSGPGNGGNSNMQMTPMQQQMMRNQQQQQQNGGQGQLVGMNQSTMQQMLVQQQQQQQQGMMNQMQMNTMHMSQTQSMSLQQQSVMNNFSQTTQQANAAMISSGQTQQAQQQQANTQQPPQTTSASISPSGNDFNFEFLENIPVGDTSGFSAQDLFNSLDNDSFNLQDMLQ